MSEPVGNTPRTREEIPGNSLKAREAKKQEGSMPAAEVERAEKIIEGKVSVRKTPWYRKISRAMVADDAKSVGDYLIEDVIVPSFKNLIADLIGQGTDRVLYGQSRPRRGSGGVVGGGIRTRYDRMHEEPSRGRNFSQGARARHDFGEIKLESRDEAVVVMQNLADRLHRFNVVSVADLYDFLGVSSSWADRDWGWYDLEGADIRYFRGEYVLDLPRPEPLRA